MLVHVNYGLRGEDSSRDQLFVEKFAADNHLDLKVIKFKSCKKEGNLEQRLRNFRYENFEKIRLEKGFSHIAVGHNMNDQSETFFLNLLRGGGMKGLGGMAEKRGKVIRPLLVFSKEEILGFLCSHGQKYRTDKTNKSSVFLRNRIRSSLIPHLEKKYLPSIKERIFEVCENLRNDYSLLERAGLLAYNEVVKRKKGEVNINVEKTRNLYRAESKFVFRRAIEEIKGNLRNVSAKNFFEFEKILQSQKSKRQLMNVGNVVIERKGNEITIKYKK